MQRPAICAGEPLVEIIAELSKDALRKKIYEREFFSMLAESSGRSDLLCPSVAVVSGQRSNGIMHA